MSNKNPKGAQRSPTDEPEKKLADVTRDTSELLEKLLADYELTAKDIAESVELYYDAQKLRILHSNKKRSEGDSPMKIWIDKWLHIGEKVLIRKLRKWVEGPEAPAEAKWAYSQIGIGPVIAAGLSAHIDVERAPTISSLWKFAGQAPGYDRKVKGQKLAFNSRLKVLCWKLGESFVKVSGKEGATYGHLYAMRKSDEIKRNEQGLYAQIARKELTIKKWKDDTITRKRLEEGKLSDGHLHARAKRRVIKIFLSHYWLRGREAAGLPITDPWVFVVGGHDKDHFIPPAA
jgi:hypothetical protein